MKDMVDLLNEKIESLEAENAQCKEAFAAVSAGKPMGPIVEKHLIQNMQRRIAELEEENERLSSVAYSMQDKVKYFEAENERLNDALLEMRMTADAESKDAERYRYARDVGLWLVKPNGLRCYRNAKADREIDAAREVE